MAINFNSPTVDTIYTDFPTQIIENIDSALQMLSVGLPTTNPTAANVPTGAIRWDTSLNRLRKWNGSAYEDLTTTYNFNANLSATQLDLGDGQKVRLGASQDLQLFHGTDNNSIIQDVGAGNLSIQSNGAEVQLAKGGGLTFAHMVRAIVDGAVMLYDSGNERLKTDGNGIQVTSRVGIGGAASHSLDVFGNVAQIGASNSQTQELRVGRSGSGNRNVDFSLIGDNTNSSYGFRITRNSGVNGNSDLKHKGNGNLRIISQDVDGDIQFFTEDTVKATLLANGNLGIGTTGPDSALHIGAVTNPALTLVGSNFNANVTYGGRSIQTHVDIRTTSMRGGVLVRNQNDFRSESAHAAFMCYDAFDTSQTTFAFRAALGATLADTFYVKNNGDSYIKTKLGIGTTSPSTTFEIASDANAQTTSTIPTVRLTNSDTTASVANIMGSFEFFTKDASDPDHITAFMRCMSLSNAGVNYDLAFGTKTTDISGDATEKMRLLSNGRLGIGTSAAGSVLHIAASSDHLLIQDTDGTNQQTFLRQSSGNFLVDLKNGNNNGTFVVRGVGGTSDEHFRITNSGRVGIGTSDPEGVFEVVSEETNGISGFIGGLKNNDNQSAVRRIQFGTTNFRNFIQSQQGSTGDTFTSNNDLLLNPSGGNVAIGTSSADVKLHVSSSDATVGLLQRTTTGNVAQEFKNNTSSMFCGLTTSATGFAIDDDNNLGVDPMFFVQKSTGNVGIGTSSPDKTFHVHRGSAGSASSDNNGVITMENSTHCILQMLSPNHVSNRIMFGDPEDQNAGEIQYDHDNNRLLITTDGEEALRINEDQMVFIGCTTEESGFGGVVIKPDATGNNGSASVVFDRANTTNSSFAFSFENNNVSSGFISYNNTTTTYNTGSDYRLKENAVAISDGITRLKTLKPYRFNFKVDPSKIVDGFFAHEVTAVPEAVTGTKDEVDSNNKPIYQGIDHGKLVPLLVAAVQELVAKVETLEAKLA